MEGIPLPTWTVAWIEILPITDIIAGNIEITNSGFLPKSTKKQLYDTHWIQRFNFAPVIIYIANPLIYACCYFVCVIERP